jgi:hypothetical protein
MKVDIVAGWHVGLGIMVSREGFALFLPIVMIMVDWTHYRFSFLL